MKTLEKFLLKNRACEDGFDFAKDLTLEQFLNTCGRGDWILWLFKRTNPNDKRLIVLTAAHCVNTVRHLMKDQRSLDAVDIAIKYGNNEATEEEWATADADADAAADDAAATAYATGDDADADADGAARAAAGKNTQKSTADICRKYLPLEIWNKI